MKIVNSFPCALLSMNHELLNRMCEMRPQTNIESSQLEVSAWWTTKELVILSRDMTENLIIQLDPGKPIN